MAPPVVNLCVLRLPFRTSQSESPFESSHLDSIGLKSKHKQKLYGFFSALEAKRKVLVPLLTNENVEEEDIDGAVEAYFSFLNHLLVPDSTGNVPLKHAFRFTWEDVLCTPQTVIVQSVEYEIVDVLLSAALWKCNQAAMRMVFAAEGLNTTSASKSFVLFRKAIGMVEHCLQRLGENEASGSKKTDTHRNVLTGLKHLLLAEIQSITVLRAIDKGNAPSLISSLAMESHQRYEECSQNINGTEGFLQKIHAYACYKSACFESYMLLYFAWTKLSASSGGMAVRLANEAQSVFERAQDLGKAYDKAWPQSNASEREIFQNALQREVTKGKKQAESDNRHVYYERVPVDLPELPQPKQLVGGINYEFPSLSNEIDRSIFEGIEITNAESNAPDTVIEIVPIPGQKISKLDGVETSNEKSESSSKGSCWRWLLVLISVPLLLIFSILGIGVWIFLIPFKIFCFPIGVLAQFIWNIVEYLIKAPLRAILWASGSPWKPTEAENTKTAPET